MTRLLLQRWKPKIPHPTNLPLVDQQGSVGVHNCGNIGGQGGTPGLGGSTGPDTVTGFDTGRSGVVKNVWGPMGMTTPENLEPGPTGAGVPVDTGLPCNGAHPCVNLTQG